MHLALPLVDELDHIASANGGNAFVSGVQSDPHGENYRSVTIDITRQDWGKLLHKLHAYGWQSFGDGVAHPLAGDNYLVVLPSF